MKAIFIKNGVKEVIELEEIDSRNRLKQMRDLIECERIETSLISEEYVAWVDEEGLFKENPKVNIVAYTQDNQIVYANEVAGNVIVTGHNASGETLGLSSEQQKDVMNNLMIIEQ